MAYYKTCPNCGAALDPGEHCDCEEIKRAAYDEANITDSKRIDKYSNNLFYHRDSEPVNLLKMDLEEQRASIANMTAEELGTALKEAILSLTIEEQLQVREVLKSITAKKQPA